MKRFDHALVIPVLRTSQTGRECEMCVAWNSLKELNDGRRSGRWKKDAHNSVWLTNWFNFPVSAKYHHSTPPPTSLLVVFVYNVRIYCWQLASNLLQLLKLLTGSCGSGQSSPLHFSLLFFCSIHFIFLVYMRSVSFILSLPRLTFLRSPFFFF